MAMRMGLAFALAIIAGLPKSAPAEMPKPIKNFPWYDTNAKNEITRVYVYLFLKHDCRQCDMATKYADEIEKQNPRIIVRRMYIEDGANNLMHQQMAQNLGRMRQKEPAFFFLGSMTSGFISAGSSGREIKDDLVNRLASLEKEKKP